MYREHAGPGLPDPWASAASNAKTMGHIQLGSVGLQVFSFVLLVIQFGPGNRGLSGDAKLTVLAGMIVYLVAMGAWAVLNAWGLGKRSKIAHWSTFAFAICQIVMCFGFIFGVGLLFLLFKKEMKGYYDARPAS